MGDGKEGCQPGGCTVPQLSTQELRQKMEFMAGNLITATEQATQCLTSFNEGFAELKETLAEFNTLMQLHNKRLADGDRRFGAMDRRAHAIERNVDRDHETLLLLGTRVESLENVPVPPAPKLVPSAFGAGAGGACIVAYELLLKMLEMLKHTGAGP